MVSCKPQLPEDSADVHTTLEDLAAKRNSLQARLDSAETAEHQWAAKAMHLNSVELETQRFQDEFKRLESQSDDNHERLAELSTLLDRNREYLCTNGTSRAVARKTINDLVQLRNELTTEKMIIMVKIQEMETANQRMHSTKHSRETDVFFASDPERRSEYVGMSKL